MEHYEDVVCPDAMREIGRSAAGALQQGWEAAKKTGSSLFSPKPTSNHDSPAFPRVGRALSKGVEEGVRGTAKYIAGAAVCAAVGAGLYAYGPSLYRWYLRKRATARILDPDSLTAGQAEALELVRDCVTSDAPADELVDQHVTPAPEEGGEPVMTPFINPYKGDRRPTRVHRGFWVLLGAKARARFGDNLRHTRENREMVYKWTMREAFEMTANPAQPQGSIRFDHLRRWLPLVVTSVFVKSQADLDHQEVLKLLEAAGRLANSDSW